VLLLGVIVSTSCRASDDYHPPSPSGLENMDAKDAVRRVFDGEVRVEVKDGRGRVIVAYYRKADGVVYVCDRLGERPIMVLDTKPKRKTMLQGWAGMTKCNLCATAAYPHRLSPNLWSFECCGYEITEEALAYVSAFDELTLETFRKHAKQAIRKHANQAMACEGALMITCMMARELAGRWYPRKE
jgi:hypothetical protein